VSNRVASIEDRIDKPRAKKESIAGAGINTDDIKKKNYLLIRLQEKEGYSTAP